MDSPATTPVPTPAPVPGLVAQAGRGGRVASAIEFAIGTALVLGHNVWKVLPNEVPILFALGMLSARVRDGGWGALGFRRPRSWGRTVLLAVSAAFVRLAGGALVIDPLTARWPAIHPPPIAAGIPHHPMAALSALGVVWTLAAFGEEVAYRGYLTRRGAEAIGGSRVGWWLATLAVAVLFGYGHYYKGPAGVLDSGFAGLVLGVTYLLAGGNLWAPVLAHGLIDTTGVVLLYLGVAN